MRLSVFRKYTLAAWNDFGASTVPAALANPATSDTFFGFACAKLKIVSEVNSATPNMKRRSKHDSLFFTAILLNRMYSASYIIIRSPRVVMEGFRMKRSLSIRDLLILQFFTRCLGRPMHNAR
jgi:hypothetical protein